MKNSLAADSEKGCLYLVATPIGNLEDITLRALRILREADLVACEDTRETAKLLSHYDIHKRMDSYHEHNELTRAPELVIEMEQGAKIALLSDAGTPVLSDPGHHLVTLCVRHSIPVVHVPGPSALVGALAASGMPTEEFTFLGFLPPRAAARRKSLRGLAGEKRTLVFYEAPHRLLDTLEDCLEILGNRAAVVAREMTKIHEEFLRGRLEELFAAFRKKAPRGEITLLIGSDDDQARPQARGGRQAPAVPLARYVEEIMKKQRVDQKTALKMAARERGMTKREAYKQLLVTRGE